ncbi:MAG: REP-associated tyrosine transposase [Pyrinomonadaceae bacterium]|jgi:REP element-mobilizing transposase RayT|nr:REP-associated tyrosine transposase [Pyrinomonadaceae bacterium]
MPATYCSLHYHATFSTKERRPLITRDWRDNLHAYLGGIIRQLDGVPLAVGGIEDHVHVLMGLRATQNVAGIMREVKGGSSEWTHSVVGKKNFVWQPGYFGVTVSPSHLDKVKAYILNQEYHHRRLTFEQEYVKMLTLAGISFDERYVW